MNPFNCWQSKSLEYKSLIHIVERICEPMNRSQHKNYPHKRPRRFHNCNLLRAIKEQVEPYTLIPSVSELLYGRFFSSTNHSSDRTFLANPNRPDKISYSMGGYYANINLVSFSRSLNFSYLHTASRLFYIWVYLL
jgi:hypothetical protein